MKRFRFLVILTCLLMFVSCTGNGQETGTEAPTESSKAPNEVTSGDPSSEQETSSENKNSTSEGGAAGDPTAEATTEEEIWTFPSSPDGPIELPDVEFDD